MVEHNTRIIRGRAQVWTVSLPLEVGHLYMYLYLYFIKYSIDLYRCGTGHLYVSIVDIQVYI